MTKLHVWLDGGVMVGIRGGGACGVGRCICGMMRIFTLGGVGAYETLGGGGAVGTLGSGVAVGTGALGGGAGIPD